MNHEFAILPWEYRGSGFDPTPHAITSLELGGRKREFLLRMREGIIYFKEPKRAPVFAVLRQFEQEMHGTELVQAWQKAVEQENYGRVASTHHKLSYSFADTIVVSIHRPDFSGWISDAFHLNWQETPPHRDGNTFDLWTGSLVQAKSRAVRRASLSLFDRMILPGELSAPYSRWFQGDEAELRRIFSLIARLFIRQVNSPGENTWYFAASNMASPGGFSYYYSPFSGPDLHSSPSLKPVIQLLEKEFGWTAMNWEYHQRISEPTDVDETDPTFDTTQKQWREWRSCYSIDVPRIEMTVTLNASLSHHERLELSLEMRDWLADKASPQHIEKWLSQIPD